MSWGNICSNVFINILKMLLQLNGKNQKLSIENKHRLLAFNHQRANTKKEKRGNTNDK